jgi:hypothetical protein
MLDVTCRNCGQPVPERQVCPTCGAEAAIAEGEPPLQCRPSLDDEAVPSILKEYHFSALRIVAYYVLVWAAFGIVIYVGLRFFGR